MNRTGKKHEPPGKYDAFISYNHADIELAAAIQHGLHRLAKPIWKPRAVRVFRDRTDTEAGPNLWPRIAAQLDASRWFVLVASPSSAISPHVAMELARWLDLGRQDRTLIALARGTVAWNPSSLTFDLTATDALPAPMFLPSTFSEMPLWVDFRSLQGPYELTLKHPAMRDYILDLASAVRGVRKSELDSTDLRDQRRLVSYRRLAITGLTILTVLSLAAGGVARWQRDVARNQTHLAQTQTLVAQANGTPDPWLAAPEAVLAVSRHNPPLAGAVDALARVGQRFVDTPFVPLGAEFGDPLSGSAGAAAWSPDGQSFVVGGGTFFRRPGETNPLRVWRLVDDSGRATLAATFSRHESLIRSAAWSPNGRLIASLDATGVALVHDAASHELVATIHVAADQNPLGLSPLAWSPDSTRIAVTGQAGMLILDARTGATMFSAPDPHVRGSDLSWAPSNLIAIAGSAGVAIFDPATANEQRFMGATSAVQSARWSPAGDRLAFLAGGALNVWTPSGDAPPTTSILSTTAASHLTWARNGTLIAAGGVDGHTAFWDLTRGRQLGGTVNLGNGGGTTFQFSPSSGMLLVTTAGRIRLWSSSALFAPSSLRRFNADAVKLAPGGRILAVRAGLSWSLVDLTTGTSRDVPVEVAASDLEWLSAHEFALADASGVAVHDQSGALRRRVIEMKDAGASRLVASPDGRRILSIAGSPGASTDLAVFDVATGKEIGSASTRGHEFVITAAWSKDGASLATTNQGGVAVVYHGDVLDRTTRLAVADVVSAYWLAPDSLRVATARSEIYSFNQAGRGVGSPLILAGARQNGEVVSAGGYLITDSDGLRLFEPRSGRQIGDRLTDPASFVSSYVGDGGSGRVAAVVDGRVVVWTPLDPFTLCTTAVQASRGDEHLAGSDQSSPCLVAHLPPGFTGPPVMPVSPA